VTSDVSVGRSRYGADSGATNRSGALKQLKLATTRSVIPSGSADAADERREFLEEAMELFQAKRVLLTAYADTDAAIHCRGVKTDYYLLKPWDPPEAPVPVVNVALMTVSSFRPPSCVVGSRWSPIASDQRLLGSEIRCLSWLDIEAGEEAPLGPVR